MIKELKKSNQQTVDEFCSVCCLRDITKVTEILSANPDILEIADSKLNLKPIFHSILCGSIEITLYLLTQGANPNSTNAIGETPLHQAADNSELELAKILFDFKANPNMKTEEGETPLHQATYRADTEMINLLLRKGACVNEANTITGKTPLIIAAENDQIECSKILLSYGADVNIKDFEDRLAKEKTENKTLRNILESYEEVFGFEDGVDLFNIKELVGDEDQASTVMSFQVSPQHHKYMNSSYSTQSETICLDSDRVISLKINTLNSSSSILNDTMIIKEDFLSEISFDDQEVLYKFLLY